MLNTFGRVLFRIPGISHWLVRSMRKTGPSYSLKFKFVSNIGSLMFPGFVAYRCVVEGDPDVEVWIIGKVSNQTKSDQRCVQITKSLWAVSTYKPKRELSDAQEELRRYIENLCWLKVKLRPDSDYYREAPPDSEERRDLERRYASGLKFILKRYRKRWFVRRRYFE